MLKTSPKIPQINDHLVVVVTGGRYFTDRRFVRYTLRMLMNEFRWSLTLVEGGCPTGVDKFVREWAEFANNVAPPRMVIENITEHANWTKYGKPAGPLRNRRMLEKYQPDFLLAFDGNDGTKGCIKIAKELGVHVRYATRVLV